MAAFGLEVQTQTETFDELKQKKNKESLQENVVMGINSFGFAGAVAHAIFEEAPKPEAGSDIFGEALKAKGETNGEAGWNFGTDVSGHPRLVPLSAKSTSALMSLAQKWTSFSDASRDAASIIAWQAMRRQHHLMRMAVVASSGREFSDALEAFVGGDCPKNVVSMDQQVETEQSKICFVFPGQGQQWANMGRELFKSQVVFRGIIEKCDAILKRISGGKSLMEDYGLFRESAEGLKMTAAEAIEKVDIIQPAILFMQIGLLHLWRHIGVTPDLVVGHSLGEVAAAYACGVLSLEEAILIIHHRSIQQVKLVGTGRMAALRMNLDEAETLCQSHKELYVAAVNAPKAVTIAGKAEIVESVVASNPGTAKQLRVSCAFHTPEMDPIKEPFMAALDGQIKNREETLPFFSTVTGKRYKGELKKDYWWSNIRQPVLFQQAIDDIVKSDSASIFIELGASVTLTSCISQICSNSSGKKPITITSGRREQNDAKSFLQGVSKLYCIGYDEFDWEKLSGSCPSWGSIPTYAWQHENHWTEPEDRRMRRLGLEDRSFKGQEGKFSLDFYPFLADHIVQNNVVFPGAGYVEYAIQSVFQDESVFPCLNDVKFTHVLNWPEEKATIQLQCKKEDSHLVISSPDHIHFEANLKQEEKTLIPSRWNHSIQLSEWREIRKETFYQNFERLGLHYGVAFQPVQKMFLGDDEAIAYLNPCTDLTQRMNVMMLDGVFQVAIAAIGGSSSLFLPVAIGQLKMMQHSIPTETPFIVHVIVKQANENQIKLDAIIATEDKKVVLKVDDFVAQNVTGTQSITEASDCLFFTEMQQKNLIATNDQSLTALKNHFNEVMSSEEGKAIASAETVLPKLQNVITTYVRHALNTVSQDVCKNSSSRYYKRFQEIALSKTPYNMEDLPQVLAKMKLAAPEFLLELDMTEKFGNMLPATLKDPASVFPYMFSAECLDSYFWNSLSTQIFYDAVTKFVITTIKESRPSKNVIRILELGGRIGGMTRKICQAINKGSFDKNVEYVFTDVSTTWFKQAQENLKEYKFIRYKQFNPEQNPLEQQLCLESFDVVINLDTIHASVSLENCMKNLNKLVCKGGALVVLEATNTFNVTELWFGALDVCWTFNDFRQKRCWADQSGYKQTMESIGLANVTCTTTPNEFFHSILVGWKQEETSQNQYQWIFVGTPGDEQDQEDFRLVKQQLKKEKNKRHSLVRALSRDGLTKTERMVYLHDNAKDNNLWKLTSFLQQIENSLDSDIERIFILSKQQDHADLSGILGLIRSASNYITGTPIHSILLKPSILPEEDTMVMAQVMESKHPEKEYIIECGVSKVPRIIQQALPAPAIQLDTPMWRMEQDSNSSKATIDTLELHAMNDFPLQDGFVKIKVKATAMNFKDVMKSLGLLDDLKEFEGDNGYGIECSGIIEELGPKVQNLKKGDEVIALADHCMASNTHCDARLVAEKPKQLSWDEAAGMAIVNLTAYTALLKKANLQEGETVLIHSACGGVGLAAINISKLCRANIICTAGTEEKRQFLRKNCGMRYVTDSRSSRFVTDVLSWTQGHGVDVILNSLSGDLLKKGMELLCHGGRFIEIGKRDMLNNSNLTMKLLLQNKSFLSCQIDLMIKEEPCTVQKYLQEITKLMSSGILKPIQTNSFDFSAYKSVFQSMAKGSHIGKNVLTIPDNFRPSKIKPPKQILKSNCFYLVTGAFGGLGLSFTSWLAEMGAKKLILTSRTKKRNAASTRLLKELKSKGVKVMEFSVDLSSQDQVRTMISQIKSSSNIPLKGIFHLGGVIEDEDFSTITEEQLNRIMGAKAKGALFLDDFTQDLSLDYFVMFSSVTTIWGQPSQPCYCAANSCLDSLAVRRRIEKTHAISLQLGAVRGAGYLEKNPETINLLEAKGMKTLHVREVWEMLKRILLTGMDAPPVVCFARQDWQLTSQFAAKDCLLFSHLAIPQQNSTEEKEKLDESKIEALLRMKLGDLLGVAPEKLDLQQPMTNYGVDSLVAIELVNWANHKLGISISQLDVLGGVTTASILQKAME